jgi:hypothetical protein
MFAGKSVIAHSPAAGKRLQVSLFLRGVTPCKREGFFETDAFADAADCAIRLES